MAIHNAKEMGGSAMFCYVDSNFQMGVGNRGFKSCPEFKNCYTTTRKTKLTNPNEIIDAIVFHGVRLNISEIQYLKEKRHLLSKVNKGIEPLYILYMLVS